MSDLISRQAAIDAIVKHSYAVRYDYNFTSIENGMTVTGIKQVLGELPSAEPETCEGCKHLGKWENEVEYGYPSPCTRCKRRVEDHYER